ncbi:hypothetical protein [Salinibacterium sp. ZJ454]|uniref:hypothetical protein n=1 Tax=Salinibacterium sp. ZJ454 TaxID=2708339 RepID=UPI0014244DF6|nr:hypothetical protein [Salinibacterium sp. ZJ454]
MQASRHPTWVLVATSLVLLVLLFWAGSRSAVCAIALRGCTTENRVALASAGALVVVIMAVITWLVSLPLRPDRSRLTLSTGTVLTAVVGVGFAAAALFSAGFALTL